MQAEANAEKACWTARRRELREWLRRNAPSLAELYEGAVSLLFDVPIPGYTRFVSHAVREIRNRLPDVISGTRSGGNLNYKGRMDDLLVVWKEAGLAPDGLFPKADMSGSPRLPASQEYPLPGRLVVMIATLLADHEASREKPTDAAIRLFEGVPENRKFRDALRPVITQWIDTTDWFMKRTHDSGTTDADVDLGDLCAKFEVFESTVLGIARGFSTFFAATKELDEILEDTDS